MQGRQRSKKPIAWLNPASWLKPVESIGVNSGKLSKDELDMLGSFFRRPRYSSTSQAST